MSSLAWRPNCVVCEQPIIEGKRNRLRHDACGRVINRPRSNPWIPATLTCAACGTEFTQVSHQQRFCSRRCSVQASNARPYRKVVNRRFPRIRYSTRRALLDRDDWRCGICHAAIDPALKWPSEGAATVDHIDPFGPHEPSNWQAAHNACNREKGRRVS